MKRNLAITYDDWDRAVTSLRLFFETNSTNQYLSSPAFDAFRNSNILTDFGGYDYEKSLRGVEALVYSLNNIEYPWHDIIISYSNQWKLIEMENNAIKIVPINIGNGQIDFWIETIQGRYQIYQNSYIM